MSLGYVLMHGRVLAVAINGTKVGFVDDVLKILIAQMRLRDC